MTNHPLPSTGNTISFNDIRIELGVPGATGFNLRGAAAGDYDVIQSCEPPRPDSVIPDAMSEWWSYNHSKTGSFWAQGKLGTCYDICNGTVGCDYSIYQYGTGLYSSTYYLGNDKCTTGTAVNNSFIAPTACSGGTFSGQTCYTFTAGVITAEQICTLCTPNGGVCTIGGDGSECCSGCCDPYGYCTANCQ